MPHGVTPRQFSTLLEGAEWQTLAQGAVLFEGGHSGGARPAGRSRLALVHSGALVVTRDGAVISTFPNELEPDVSSAGWVGDLAFLEAISSGEQRLAPAHLSERVSVVTTAQCNRLLVWDGERLRQQLSELGDTELLARLQQVLIASLANKLFASQQAVVASVPSLHHAQLVDLDGDGKPDAAVVDTVGDGKPDTIVEWSDLLHSA